MAKAKGPEDRGHELIEELERTLNEEFEDMADYRAAIEEALSFLESIISGLDADEKRAGREGG
mgnify:CR=1 FL=1